MVAILTTTFFFWMIFFAKLDVITVTKDSYYSRSLRMVLYVLLFTVTVVSAAYKLRIFFTYCMRVRLWSQY